MRKVTLYLLLSLLLIAVLFVMSWTDAGHCCHHEELKASTRGTAIYHIDSTKVKAIYFTTHNVTTIMYYVCDAGVWKSVGQEKIDNTNYRTIVDTFTLNDVDNNAYVIRGS